MSVKDKFSNYIKSKLKYNKSVKIVVVCSGNIIRSPFVELVLKTNLASESKVQVESGACFYQNTSLLEFTKQWLHNFGIPEHLIAEFRPRSLLSHDFSDTDVFIVMTGEHLKFLKENYVTKKAFLIKQIANSRSEDVLDPYFNSQQETQIMEELHELSLKLSQIIKESLIS